MEVDLTRSRQQERATELEETLRPSGALLETQTVLSRAIQDLAVARTEHDATTLDLLIRLRLAPQHRLRGVDLCRQLLKSPSHISRMIDRAETDGLVQRQPDPDDRRAQQIALTDAGERAVEGFTPHLVEVLKLTIHNTLTNKEIQMLIDILSRITRSARRLIEDQTPTITTRSHG